MAKQSGIIRINGTLDGVTFYNTRDGNLVRKAGGIDKKRINSDPGFARTRENMAEFKNIATSARFLRTSMVSLLKKAKDFKMSRRLFTVFTGVKNLDGTNLRGQRTVAGGLATIAGQELFRGFDFNANATLTSVLQAPFTQNQATGEVSIAAFDPQQHVRIPQGATHVGFSTALVALDLQNGAYSIEQSNPQNLSVTAASATVTTTPATVPVGTGFMFMLLLIEFFQEVNTVQYPLNNGSFNVLNLLDVRTL